MNNVQKQRLDELESGPNEVYRSMGAAAWAAIGSVLVIAVVVILVWQLMVSAASGLYVYGDVDGDGQRTWQDAEAILQHDVGLTPDGFIVQQCDVNGDGACNVIDALFVQQCVVGIANQLCPVVTPAPEM